MSTDRTDMTDVCVLRKLEVRPSSTLGIQRTDYMGYSGVVILDGMADEALEEPAWQMVGVAYATRWRRLVLYCRRVRSWQRIWGIIGQRLQEVKKPLRDRLKKLWPAPSQLIY